MPRARLADVALASGVSTATASLVLRGKPGPSARARAAVQEAADRLGYRPDRTASLLARHRTHLVGVLLDVSSAFHAELVDHLDAAAAAHGYDLVLGTVTSRRDERHVIETLLDFRCEGLVLLGPTMSERQLAATGQACPTVVIGRPGVPGAQGAPGVESVRAADDLGMAAAVDHLVSLGHRSIAYVDGPRGTIASARRRGYRAAMRRHGLSRWVEVRPGGATEAAGVRAGEALLADRLDRGGLVDPAGVVDRAEPEDPAGRPSAVVTFNDRCAVGLREALVRHGLSVPADLSLVGYDDSPLARLSTIDLTSVSQDPPALAAASMTALAERLEGPAHRQAPAGDAQDHRDVVIPPRLVVRTSTQRVR